MHDTGMYGIVISGESDVSLEDRPIIGIVGLGFENGSPELGYALKQEYRRKGYGYEAACLVLEDYLGNIGIDCINRNDDSLPEIVVEITEGNEASMHLAMRLTEKYKIKIVTVTKWIG